MFEPLVEELRRGGSPLQELDAAALAAALFDLGERRQQPSAALNSLAAAPTCSGKSGGNYLHAHALRGVAAEALLTANHGKAYQPAAPRHQGQWVKYLCHTQMTI